MLEKVISLSNYKEKQTHDHFGLQYGIVGVVYLAPLLRNESDHSRYI